MNITIKQGDRVYIKSEWMDAGEHDLVYIATCDQRDDGSVEVTSINSGLSFPPVNTLSIFMIGQL